MIEGMNAYQKCLAIKLHFTNPSYDYFKYNGKVREFNEDSVSVRPDFMIYRRIERRYKNELETFFLSNIVERTIKDEKIWVGDFLKMESEKSYKEWKKKYESAQFNLRQELMFLEGEVVLDKLLFKIPKKGQPEFLRLYLAEKVSMESLIAINMIFPFKEEWDKNLNDAHIWPRISTIMTKYQPFLRLDKEEVRQILDSHFVDEIGRDEYI